VLVVDFNFVKEAIEKFVVRAKLNALSSTNCATYCKAPNLDTIQVQPHNTPIICSGDMMEDPYL
jgi:hypothetical protein